MILNDHVNIDTTQDYADIFTPDDGYALWDETEEGNLDENGNPMVYWYTIIAPKSKTEELAPHIFARLIDDTMSVMGDDRPSVY